MLAVLLVVAARPRTRALLAADLTSHAKGFAFLTIVAATNVLGSASGVDPRLVGPGVGAVVAQPRRSGRASSTPRSSPSSSRGPKPGLGAGINGTWFLLTVSTESIAVLGALLLGRHPSDAPRLRAASPRSPSASCST